VRQSFLSDILSGMRLASALLSTVFLSATLSAQDGSAIYRERCATCNDGGTARAPQLAALKQMSSANVEFALKYGSMVLQGQGPKYVL